MATLLRTATSRRLLIVKKWFKIFSISRLIRWSIVLVLSWWLYQNWHADIAVSELTAHYTWPDSKFIQMDGMNVHYRETGKGETMLLLHDDNSSLQTWAAWTAQLSQKYRVISVDLPGFGLTGPHPKGSYSAFMYASFLDSLVQRLDLKKFNLAGNGLGAQIAWFYAAETQQNRLSKLILLDAPGYETKSTPLATWLARIPVVNRALWTITPRDYIELMLQDVYADDALVTDSVIQRHFDLLRYPGSRKAFTDRAQVSYNRPPVDIIEKINVPTLILWGAEDTRLSPEQAYEFHRHIRGALLRIYQNTGHWPQEENPAQTVADVEAFLEGKF